MATTIVNAQNQSGSSVINIAVNAVLTVGNLAVCIVSVKSPAVITQTSSTWNEVSNHSADLSTYVCWRIAAGGDTLSINFSIPSTWSSTTIQFTGQADNLALLSSTVDTSQSSNNNAISVTTGSALSSTEPGALLIPWMAISRGARWANSITDFKTNPPTGGAVYPPEQLAYARAGGTGAGGGLGFQETTGPQSGEVLTWVPTPEVSPSDGSTATGGYFILEPPPPPRVFGIFSGANEILEGALNLGTTAIQEVYWGALKIWPAFAQYMKGNSTRYAVTPLIGGNVLYGSKEAFDFTLQAKKGPIGTKLIWLGAGRNVFYVGMNTDQILITVGRDTGEYDDALLGIAVGDVFTLRATRPVSSADVTLYINDVLFATLGIRDSEGACSMLYADEYQSAKFKCPEGSGFIDFECTSISGGVVKISNTDGAGSVTTCTIDGAPGASYTWTPDVDWVDWPDG